MSRESEKARAEHDNLRLRAEARALLADPRRPRHLLVTGPIAAQSSKAIIGIDGPAVVRHPGEAYEDFEKRVWDALPAVGPPTVVIMVPGDL